MAEIKREHESSVESASSGLLYGVVQWINGKPILDGMKAFSSQEKAIAEANEWESGPIPDGVELRHTIIRIKTTI